jgi:hypothetical protein
MAWTKGQTGNPAGRPPKADPGRARLREAIAKKLPKIVKKLEQLALAGDVQAARTLMERALPPLRAQSARVVLPELAAAANPTAQAALIVKAVAEGNLLPDEAGQLLAGIGQVARIAEIDQLEQRIQEMEEQLGRRATT